MHAYSDLVQSMIHSASSELENRDTQALTELENGAETHHIKTLQQNNLHRTVLAIGVLSLFEARLQDELGAKKGFEGAKAVLKASGEIALLEEFDIYIKAINVLKHGRGCSYDYLVARRDKLPFNVKNIDESFFDEGDVGEVSTLVEVNRLFMMGCVDVVSKVAQTLNSVRGTSL